MKMAAGIGNAAKRIAFAVGGFAFGAILTPFVPFACAWLWMRDADYDDWPDPRVDGLGGLAEDADR